MTMFKTTGKANSVHCYCKVCGKEHEINIIDLVRNGNYCECCLKEKTKDGERK